MPGVRSGSSVGPGNGQTGSERVNGSLGLSRGAGRVPDRLGGAEEEGSGFCRRLPAHLHRHTHLIGAAFHSLRAAQGRGLQPETLWHLQPAATTPPFSLQTPGTNPCVAPPPRGRATALRPALPPCAAALGSWPVSSGRAEGQGPALRLSPSPLWEGGFPALSWEVLTACHTERQLLPSCQGPLPGRALEP